MSEPVRGRLPTYRSTAIWRYRCYADPRYFLAWDEVPEALKDELEANGGLPCEGGGVPGFWCQECRFGTGEELTPNCLRTWKGQLAARYAPGTVVQTWEALRYDR